MTNKEFLKQLNDLKNIRPQSTWLKSNREILLSQISNSGAEHLSYWQKLSLDIKSYTLILSKPAIVMSSLVAILVATATYAHLAFNNTRYDDSLYIAKRISEKAKLTTVFNVEEREKLEAKFAAGHAEGITASLAQAKIESANEDQLAIYTEDFKKEIDIVREKMVVIAQRNTKPQTVSQLDSQSSIDLNQEAQASSSVDDLVVAAESGKDEKGTQININITDEEELINLAGKKEGDKKNNNNNNNNNNNADSKLEETDKGSEASNNVKKNSASSSDLISSSTNLTEASISERNLSEIKLESKLELKANLSLEQTKQIEGILDEAQALVDSGNFAEANLKIKEVKVLIK